MMENTARKIYKVNNPEQHDKRKSTFYLIACVFLYLFFSPIAIWAQNNISHLSEEAEKSHLSAVEKSEHKFGPEHPRTAEALFNLAWFYHRTGVYAKALPVYLRSLAIREKSLPSLHEDIAHTLNNLAGLHNTMGAYFQAEKGYKKLLEINE